MKAYPDIEITVSSLCRVDLCWGTNIHADQKDSTYLRYILQVRMEYVHHPCSRERHSAHAEKSVPIVLRCSRANVVPGLG